MKSEKNTNFKTFWYWVLWVIIIFMAIKIFDSINKIEEVENQIDNLKSKIARIDNKDLTTLYLKGGYSMDEDTICCPSGYVRTGCSMQQSTTTPNGVVYPTDNQCCTGYKVYFWTICLRNK